MRNSKKLSILLTLIILASFAFAQNKKDISLTNIWITYDFYPRSINGGTSMIDGVSYSLKEGSDINIYSYETGKLIKTALDGSKITSLNDGNKIKVDDYAFSPDEKMILLSAETEAIYRHSTIEKNYIYNIEKNTLTIIGDGAKQRLASFSADNKKLAYVRDNNIYIYYIDDKKEIQITKDGKHNEIINGAPDWVYEEEFGFARGFYWSPDGNRLAYMKFDESKVKEWNMTMYGDLYPEQYKFKYPKAGEDNSILTVHVYDLENEKTTTMDVGEETDQYIPRIKWTTDADKLCIMRLNRLQNKLDLLLANANDGNSQVIYKEENKYYVEVSDNLIFLENNEGFLWTSEKDGYNHIYQFDMNGNLVKQITKGNWDVVSFKGFDEKNKVIYYIAAEKSPTQRELYSINLDGSGKKLLSENEGTNDAKFSSTFDYYINYFSSANRPNLITMHTKDGKKIRDLETNEELIKKMEAYNFQEKEFFDFKTSQGVELNGWMIKPYNFDKKKKYPVLMYCYGGPGHNTVNDAWEYNSIWHQYLANLGYIVVSVDNRGTGWRGEEFKKMTYKELGKYETIDQIEGAKYLQTLKFVDPDRIGIQGWSFGGYLSSLALLKGNDVFKMAIAVAPVTNWRYYDNIYTERYMRTPQENSDGYDQNSPINFVKDLKGAYLIIHGGGDDNVHVQNTMEMVLALNNANKEFDMHIYPNKNHGIYGGYTRYHLFKKMTDFVLENL
jgi:dipeptidyl-peptidase-4